MTRSNANFRQRARELAEREARELRHQIRALAEGRWCESVDVVYLEHVAPRFDVPGRRRNGAVKVKGKRLVGRIFGRFLYGIVGGLFMAVLAIVGGSWSGHASAKRSGRVVGPENAQALGLVDAARSAGGPCWLVYSAQPADDPLDYSPSNVAVVTTAIVNDLADISPPKFVWHAAKPQSPRISPDRQRLVWPDGSMFDYHVGDEAKMFLMRSLAR
jgi:hypothetical protein